MLDPEQFSREMIGQQSSSARLRRDRGQQVLAL